MLNRLWEACKGIARRIGDFQARVLLTVIYAVVVLPFGVFLRTFGDPLRIRRRPTKWVDIENKSEDLVRPWRQW
jgi:hypothetical protein